MGGKVVPFRDHATSFTPEQLDVLTTAFYAAMAELTTAGVAISQRDLANREPLDSSFLGCPDSGVLTGTNNGLNGWS